jgi:hypothetical protein
MDLPNIKGAKKYYSYENPFDKVIVDDYYDGSISGFIQSYSLNTSYYFKLIAWDDEQNRRLFALYDFPSDEFFKLERELAHYGEIPNYPIWVLKWKFDSNSSEKNAELAIKLAMDKKLDIRTLMLTEQINGEILLISNFTNIVDKLFQVIDSSRIDSLDYWLVLLNET